MNLRRSLTRIFFAIVIVPCSVFALHINGFSQEKVLAKEEDKIMLSQLSSKNEPERVVLEGVPHIDWYTGTPVGSVTPFVGSLWACMESLGEDYTYEYIMGTSGAAFRLFWASGWSIENPAIEHIPNDPIRRVFESVGYTYRAAIKQEGRDNEAYFRNRIIESIRDKCRPVIAFGVIPPSEPCVIAGYDEHGDVLIGWSYFQGSPGDEGKEFEPSGYFRKRDWFKDTDWLIIIGDKGEKPPLSEIYRNTLKYAIELTRTPKVESFGSERPSGLAAYTAWAEDLLRDEDFPMDNMAVLSQRMLSHDENANVVAEGRWCAAQVLKQMAKDEPVMADGLLAAAECYEAEYSLIHQSWDIVGGDSRSEAHARKLAEPDIRRQTSSIILKARDKDEEAANHIERALAK